MTFIPEPRIEARAAEIWRTHRLTPAFETEDLAERLGLSVLWEPIKEDDTHRVLGQLDPNDARIILNETRIAELEKNDGRLRRYTMGHEIGHWLFHCEMARSGALSLFVDGRIWCRDGSTDPIERQADLFAARLLMPQEIVRNCVPKAEWQGWPTVYELADEFLVNATPMMIRLEELRLAHRDDNGQPRSGPRPPTGQATLFV